MSYLISQLPWQFVARDRTGDRSGRSLLVVDATGRKLLQVNDYADRDEYESITTAAFIARAANAHHGLVDALQEAISVIEKIKPEQNGYGTIVRGKQALAKANGDAA